MQLAGQLTKTLDPYELRAVPMTSADVPQLHALSVSVVWPHRPEDWDLVIRHGHGLVARDEIERLVGSAMWFPLGDSHAAVGMVITSPRLQEHGTGRWLMGLLMDQIGDRGLVLNATRPAYRLYISLGFMPLSPVFQHNGEVTAVPDADQLPALPGTEIRPMAPQDHAAIRALDHVAFGLDRAAVVTEVIGLSHGTVLTRGGVVRGFALCRRFGRGHVIGPVVAETETEVLHLIAPIVAGHRGQFLRMDTRAPDGALRRFLVAHGLVHHDTVTRMVLGAPLPAPGVAAGGQGRTFGLLNQAFG
ncbi:MAG: GNAT family N-acetyltransferase [Rhodobacteraceae bacterium]|jgi:GNAT superfamily N-acetyltransferase|nr:GNAT family N-acetyltransferase [Paracoccaceae bacterium]